MRVPLDVPCARALHAIALLSVLVTATQAQSRELLVTGNAGIGGSRFCTYQAASSGALLSSLDVRTTGTVFPVAELSYIYGNSTTGDRCGLPPETGVIEGGLQLKSSTRMLLGVGVRPLHGRVQLEVAALVGAINGQPGFSTRDTPNAKRLLPHAGIGASFVFFKHVVIGADLGKTRITTITTPPQGAPQTLRSWESMTYVRAGLRWGLPFPH
jgi:hypothetical protein